MGKTLRRNKQGQKIKRDDDHNSNNPCNCSYCGPIQSVNKRMLEEKFSNKEFKEDLDEPRSE